MVVYIHPIIIWLATIPIVLGVWFAAFFLIGITIRSEWFGRLVGDSWKVRNFVEAIILAFLILLPAFTSVLIGLAYHKLGLF